MNDFFDGLDRPIPVVVSKVSLELSIATVHLEVPSNEEFAPHLDCCSGGLVIVRVWFSGSESIELSGQSNESVL